MTQYYQGSTIIFNIYIKEGDSLDNYPFTLLIYNNTTEILIPKDKMTALGNGVYQATIPTIVTATLPAGRYVIEGIIGKEAKRVFSEAAFVLLSSKIKKEVVK